MGFNIINVFHGNSNKTTGGTMKDYVLDDNLKLHYTDQARAAASRLVDAATSLLPAKIFECNDATQLSKLLRTVYANIAEAGVGIALLLEGLPAAEPTVDELNEEQTNKEVVA